MLSNFRMIESGAQKITIILGHSMLAYIELALYIATTHSIQEESSLGKQRHIKSTKLTITRILSAECQ